MYIIMITDFLSWLTGMQLLATSVKVLKDNVILYTYWYIIMY